MADEATQNKQAEVATILKGLATNEMAHAKVFYDYIAQNTNEIGLKVDIKASYPMAHAPLIEMLKIKAENEDYQAQTVYPAFAKTAKKEGFEDIAKKLMIISDIENNHNIILKKLYERLKQEKLYVSQEKMLWKCTNCGYQEENKKAWKKCPLCQKDQGMVKINL